MGWLQSWAVGLLLTAGLVVPSFAQSSGIRIRIEQAIAIARQAIPNQMIVEAELKRSRSGGIWEIEFDNKAEVYIDATTGQVLKIELDD